MAMASRPGRHISRLDSRRQRRDAEAIYKARSQCQAQGRLDRRKRAMTAHPWPLQLPMHSSENNAILRKGRDRLHDEDPFRSAFQRTISGSFPQAMQVVSARLPRLLGCSRDCTLLQSGNGDTPMSGVPDGFYDPITTRWPFPPSKTRMHMILGPSWNSELNLRDP
jgi:hypothetical protein